MAFEQAYLAAHPLPPGIVGSLGLGGYQLLVDIAGVGAGRLGPQAFLLVAPEPDPRCPSRHPDLAASLKLRDEPRWPRSPSSPLSSATCALSGYRLALERHGLRSQINVVNPATGAIAVDDPRQAPAVGCSAGVLPRARCWLRCARCLRRGRRRTSQNSRGASSGAARAGAARRDRRRRGGRGARRPRLELVRADRALDPPAALEAASGRATRQSGRRVYGRPDRPIQGPARELRSARSDGFAVRNVVPEWREVRSPRRRDLAVRNVLPLCRSASAGTTSHGRHSSPRVRPSSRPAGLTSHGRR